MSDFGRLFGVFDDYFEPISPIARQYIPGLRTHDKDDGIEIEVDLPGFSKKDVKVSVERGFLYLKADNGKRKWRKSYSLSEKFNGKKVKARMKSGVFTIFIPYKDSEVIEVEIE